MLLSAVVQVVMRMAGVFGIPGSLLRRASFIPPVLCVPLQAVRELSLQLFPSFFLV